MFGLFNKNSGKFINVNDIDTIIDKIDLIDIRETFEYRKESIESSKNIPMRELLEDPDRYLEKDKEYHIICQSGGRSHRACNELTSLGYNVINVAGGVGSYSGSKRK